MAPFHRETLRKADHPNLAAEYGVRSGYPERPAIDGRMMMQPPPAALSNGTARHRTCC